MTTERHTAHQQRSAEVTIYYRYHPLRTQNLPVVRVYDFHDEVYYVVRRADGTPLAVPAWMTRPEAAHAKIVAVAPAGSRAARIAPRHRDLPFLKRAQCARGGSRCRVPEPVSYTHLRAHETRHDL